MSLIFDQNLSPRLVDRLHDLFPECTHVSLVSLDRASDRAVWEHARDNDLVFVTKDLDFSDMSVLYGSPPKVIWLRLGNCTRVDVEQALRRAFPQIVAFLQDSTLTVLELL